MKLKITKQMLERLRACSSAIRFVTPLLPAVVSTDPDDNMGLAIRAIALYENTPTCGIKTCKQCRRSLVSDLRWLMDRRCPDRANDFNELDWGGGQRSRRPDILDIVQMLSFIAEPVQKEE